MPVTAKRRRLMSSRLSSTVTPSLQNLLDCSIRPNFIEKDRRLPPLTEVSQMVACHSRACNQRTCYQDSAAQFDPALCAYDGNQQNCTAVTPSICSSPMFLRHNESSLSSFAHQNNRNALCDDTLQKMPTGFCEGTNILSQHSTIRPTFSLSKCVRRLSSALTLFLCLFLLPLTQISLVRCKGILTIELLAFNNSLGLTATGDCCDGALLPSASMCTGQCDMQFLMCVDEFRSPYSIDQCKLQKITPHIWHDQDVFAMPPNSHHHSQFDPSTVVTYDQNNLPNDISFLTMQHQNIDGLHSSSGSAYGGGVLEGAPSSNSLFYSSPNSARVPSTQLSHAQEPSFYPLSPSTAVLRPASAALWEPPALSGRIGSGGFAAGPSAAPQMMLVTTNMPPVSMNPHRQKLSPMQQKQQKLIHPADYMFSTSPPSPTMPSTKTTWRPDSHVAQQQPRTNSNSDNNNALMNRSAAPGPNVFGLNNRQPQQQGINPQLLQVNSDNNAHGVNLLKFYYEHWPGQVTIKIEARDIDSSRTSERSPTYDIVDAYQLDLIQFKPFPYAGVGNESNLERYRIFPLAGMRTTFPPTQLTIRAGFECAENFYGPDCAVECFAQDTCEGHFMCDTDTGLRKCRPGWLGPHCDIQSRVDTVCPPEVFCVNGGVPVCQGPSIGQYYCCCAAGFAGQFCEIIATNNDGGPPVIPVIRPSPQNPDIKSSRTNDTSLFHSTSEKQFSPPLRPSSDATTFFQLPGAGKRQPPLLNSNPDFMSPSDGLTPPSRRPPFTPSRNPGGMHPMPPLLPIALPTTIAPGVGFTTYNNVNSARGDDHHHGGSRVLPPQSVNPPPVFSGNRPDLQLTNNVCQPNPCFNDAKCEIFSPPNSRNPQFTCQCTEDFKGQFCERPVTCVDGPCLNDGVCRDEPLTKTYFCECATQYVGRRCEVPVTCDYQPCLNGGSCIFSDNTGFQCLCPKKFNGIYCELPAFEPCQQNPCQNNGGCYMHSNGTVACRCANEFRGRWCEMMAAPTSPRPAPPPPPPNPCDKQPCENGGFCTSTGRKPSAADRGFVCHCEAPFTGDFCELQLHQLQQPQLQCVNSAGESPCKNGATCSQNRLGLVCICPSNWMGDFCQIPRQQSHVDNARVLDVINGQNDLPQFLNRGPGLAGVTRQPPFSQHEPTTAFVPWWQNNRFDYSNPTTDPPILQHPPLDEASSIQPALPDTTLHWRPKLHDKANKNNTSRSCVGVLTPDYCLNGGACEMTQANTYVCHCTDEYAGSRCEVRIQPPLQFDKPTQQPTSDPPPNRQKSFPLATRSPLGFPTTQQQSSSSLFLCPDLPCANDGICREVLRPPASYTRACACGPLFYGRLCEHELRTSSPCPPPDRNTGIGGAGVAFQIPCRHNGACALPRNALPACLCQPGFFGDLCQFAESDAILFNARQPGGGLTPPNIQSDFDPTVLFNTTNPFLTNNINIAGANPGSRPPSSFKPPISSSIATRRPSSAPPVVQLSTQQQKFVTRPPSPTTVNPGVNRFSSPQDTQLTSPPPSNDVLLDGLVTSMSPTTLMPEQAAMFALVIHGALQPPAITNELINQLEKVIKDAWISYYVGLNDPSIRLRILIDRKRVGEPYYGWENGQWYEVARIPYAVMLNGQPYEIEMVPHERFQPALKRANLSFLVFVGDIAFPQARTFDQFVYGKLPLKMAMNLEHELLQAWRKALNLPPAKQPTVAGAAPTATINDASSLYVIDVGDYVQQITANTNTNLQQQAPADQLATDSPDVVVGKPVTRLMYILVLNGTAVDPQKVPRATQARFFNDLLLTPCLNCTLDNSLRMRRLVLRINDLTRGDPLRLDSPSIGADSSNLAALDLATTNNIRNAILSAWRDANPRRQFTLRSLDIESDHYVDQNMTSVRVVDYALATVLDDDLPAAAAKKPKSGDLRTVVAPSEIVMMRTLRNTANATVCVDCEALRVYEVKLLLPFIFDAEDVQHVHQALRRSWLRQNLLSAGSSGGDQSRTLIDIHPLRVMDAQFGLVSGVELQAMRYVVDLQEPAMNPAMQHHLQAPSTFLIEDELGPDFKGRLTQEDYMQPLSLAIPGLFNVPDKKLDQLRQTLLTAWLTHQPTLQCLSVKCNVQIVLLKPFRSVVPLPLTANRTSVSMASGLTIPYYVMRDTVRLGASTKDLPHNIKQNVLEQLGFVAERAQSLPTTVDTSADPASFIVYTKAFNLLLNGELQLDRDSRALQTALAAWLPRAAPAVTYANVVIIEVWPYTRIDNGEQVTQITFVVVHNNKLLSTGRVAPNVIDARVDGVKLQKLMNEAFVNGGYAACNCRANRIEHIILRPPRYNTEEELVDAFFRLLRSMERAIVAVPVASAADGLATTPFSASSSKSAANLTLMHAEQGYKEDKQEVVLAIIANSHPLYPDILYNDSDDFLYANLQQAVLNEGFGWCATADCSFSPLFTLILEPTVPSVGPAAVDLFAVQPFSMTPHQPLLANIIDGIERVWRRENDQRQQNVLLQSSITVILFNFTEDNSLVSSVSGQRVLVLNYIVRVPAYVVQWPTLRVPSVASISAELARSVKLQQCANDCVPIEPAHFVILNGPATPVGAGSTAVHEDDFPSSKTIEMEMNQALMNSIQPCSPPPTTKPTVGGGLVCRAHVVDIKSLLDADGREARRIDYVIHSPHGGIMMQSEFLKAKLRDHFMMKGYQLPPATTSGEEQNFVPLSSLQTVTIFGRVTSQDKRLELEQALQRAIQGRAPEAAVTVRVMKMENQIEPIRDIAFTKVFFSVKPSPNPAESADSLTARSALLSNNNEKRLAQALNELNSGFRACIDPNECAQLATLREVIVRGEFDAAQSKDDRLQLAAALSDAWAFANPVATRQDLDVTIRATEPFWAFVTEINNQTQVNDGSSGEPVTRITYFIGRGITVSSAVENSTVVTPNTKALRTPNTEFLKRALQQKGLKLCAQLSARQPPPSQNTIVSSFSVNNNCLAFKKHKLYIQLTSGLDEQLKEPHIESLVEQAMRLQMSNVVNTAADDQSTAVATPQVPVRARILNLDDNFVNFNRRQKHNDSESLQILMEISYIIGTPGGKAGTPNYQNIQPFSRQQQLRHGLDQPQQDMLSEIFQRNSMLALCPAPKCEPTLGQPLYLVNLPLNTIISPVLMTNSVSAAHGPDSAKRRGLTLNEFDEISTASSPVSAALDYVANLAEISLTVAYRSRVNNILPASSVAGAENNAVKVKVTRSGIAMVGRYNTPVLKLLMAPINIATQQVVKPTSNTNGAFLPPEAVRATLEADSSSGSSGGGLDVYRYGDDLLPLSSAFAIWLPAHVVENATRLQNKVKDALVQEWQRRVVGAHAVDVVMTLDYVNAPTSASIAPNGQLTSSTATPAERIMKVYYLLQKSNNVAIDSRSLPLELIDQVHNTLSSELTPQISLSRTVPIRILTAEIEPTNSRFLRAVRDASLPALDDGTSNGAQISNGDGVGLLSAPIKLDLLRALETLWSTITNPARAPSVRIELLELRPMVDENLVDYLQLKYYVYSTEAKRNNPMSENADPVVDESTSLIAPTAALREPTIARTREAFKPLGLNVCIVSSSSSGCKVNPSYTLLLVEDDTSPLNTPTGVDNIQNLANERVREQIEQAWQALNTANWNGFFSLAFINMRWLPRARLEFRYGVFPSVVSGQKLVEPTVTQLDEKLRQIGLQVCKTCGQPLPEVYLMGPVRQLGDEMLKSILVLAWEKQNEALVNDICSGEQTGNNKKSACALVEPKIIGKTEFVGKLGTDVWKVEYQLRPTALANTKIVQTANKTAAQKSLRLFHRPIPLQTIYDILEEQPLALYEPAATIAAPLSTSLATVSDTSAHQQAAVAAAAELSPKSALFSLKTEGVLTADQIERIENELTLLWRAANPTDPPQVRVVEGNVFVILNSALDLTSHAAAARPPPLGTEILYRVTRSASPVGSNDGSASLQLPEEPRNTELHVPVEASLSQALRDKLSIIPCAASPACTKHSHRLYDVYLRRPWLEAQNIELVKALESAWASRISDSSIQVHIIDGAPYAALTYNNQIPEWEQVTRVRYATIPAYPPELLPGWTQIQRALETFTPDARLVQTSPHRLHTILVHGSGVNLIRRDLPAVTGALLNAWASVNRLQPATASSSTAAASPNAAAATGNNIVRITITSATQTLINVNGTSITFVEYFLTIDGVPLQNHMFVREPTRQQFDAYLRNVGYPICDCLARGRKYFFLRGVNATSRAVQNALEHGLEQAWQVRNALLVGRQQLKVEVIDVDNKFEDKQNREVSRITYDVFLKFDQDKLPDLSLPTLKEIEKHMKSFLANNPRIDVLENAIVHEKLVDSSGQPKSGVSSSLPGGREINLLSAWAIAVIALVVWVAVLLVVVMLILACRQRRNRRKRGDISATNSSSGVSVTENSNSQTAAKRSTYFSGIGGKTILDHQRYEREHFSEAASAGHRSSGTSHLSNDDGGHGPSSLVEASSGVYHTHTDANVRPIPNDISARVAMLFQAPNSSNLQMNHRQMSPTAIRQNRSILSASRPFQSSMAGTEAQQVFRRTSATRIPDQISANVDVEDENIIVRHTTTNPDDDRL